MERDLDSWRIAGPRESGLIIDLGTHVALTGVYQRSLRQSLDTVAFGVSYTLGKCTNRSILQ